MKYRRKKMPRLDIWLVKNGKAPSRQIAKRMIKSGYVKVNGRIGKPSTFVKGSETIEVSDKATLYPIGYEKLKAIDILMDGNIARAGDLALDIGSSAGGFLLYLAEKGIHSIGIEISDEFYEVLKEIERENENITILFDDAFTINPANICSPNSLDLLLIDVTTEPSGTLKLIDKFLPLLKSRGKLVSSFKTKIKTEIDKNIAPLFKYFSAYHLFTINSEKEEIHFVAIRL
jgi:23S rRNA (cytidine1920-2'-O)/16S rRNA (cytidine1409-2'-O)-methyltransferase